MDDHSRFESGYQFQEEYGRVRIDKDTMRSVKKQNISGLELVELIKIAVLKALTDNFIAEGVDRGARFWVQGSNRSREASMLNRVACKLCRISRSNFQVARRRITN